MPLPPQVLATNNFLAMEGELIARLKQAVAGRKPAVHVLTAAELAQVEESRQPTPALHLTWQGFRVLESRADGAAAALEHTWLLVASVRNVRDIKCGSPARAEAGALIALGGPALMGFKPSLAASPIRLASGSPAAGFASGYMYLPLALTVTTHFSAR